MGPRDTLLAGLARQLGNPSGLPGRAVGRLLNRANRGNMTAAVEALDLKPGETALDIGFGGGLGLDLLLRAAAGGTVHGVDISDTMIAKARAAFPANIAAGRLRLHRGTMTALPLEDASMAAAITLDTVYFIDDLDLGFAEVARVLTPGGRFVLGIGDPEAMKAMPFTEHGFRLRPVADVETALGEAGLRLDRHQRIGEGTRAFHLLITSR
ncbi:MULTISPECIES: class I SAM-dependent methyltransferase [unclassified Amycolatopsis]|uniref:class I SAM-dependent methyltransferase n=1 Tax=unclassified Amycolatopsis TaxID=2618356 RepID=UPI001C6A1E49|nr:class I SAM-dependent methyltransferase [Amycolatopsis sp. DSM 110486]QYN21832.1 class I SAM-dependent methyltransferase [Amycolatopsis sp. DSM 110486]